MNFAALTAPDGEPVYIAPGFIVRQAIKEESVAAAKTRIDAGGVVTFVSEDVNHVLAELKKL
jgi:hypothetical protein